eukprot:TRINITY_DN48289_c1_g3_i1.p3 TRINITY_DN48289_c1_g3~~TRINITY_DN48289_c1_g3_i1.p3  ORF type:complete len:242 (+),score=47.75 TRINITY_DN48289_c1_g3_i1:77-727(+)
MSCVYQFQFSCKSQIKFRPQKGHLQVCAAVKKASTQSIVCAKQFLVKEGQTEEVQKLGEELMSFTNEQKSIKENGILEFELFQDVWEQNVFHSWERYQNSSCMNKFNSQQQVKDFMDNVYEHLESPIGIALYEWNNGNIGNACVQMGPRGEGGLDDATGASGTRSGAGMKQTSMAAGLGDVKRGEEGDSFGMTLEFPWLKKMKDQLFGAASDKDQK